METSNPIQSIVYWLQSQPRDVLNGIAMFVGPYLDPKFDAFEVFASNEVGNKFLESVRSRSPSNPEQVVYEALRLRELIQSLAMPSRQARVNAIIERMAGDFDELQPRASENQKHWECIAQEWDTLVDGELSTASLINWLERTKST